MRLGHALILLAVCGVAATAGEATVGAHRLFGFEAGAEGWRPNVWGKGQMWAERAPEAKVGRGAMAVHFRDLAGANLISPPIPAGEPWRQRRHDRVRFWAKGAEPMTRAKITFATDEAEHSTYTLQFPMQSTDWQWHTYPLTRCWNRGGRRLDASRIVRVYITGAGTVDFAIDHLELLEAGREVWLRPDAGEGFARACGLADLVAATAVDRAVHVGDVRLEEQRPGQCILRCRTKATEPTPAAWRVWIEPPGGRLTSRQGEVAIPAREDELAVPVAFEAAAEGEAKLAFALTDAQGRRRFAHGAYAFTLAFPRDADLSRLVLVPTPKELELADGHFAVNGETILWIGDGEREGFVAEVVEREIQEHYGVQTAVRRRLGPADRNVILVGRPESNAVLREALAERKLLERLGGLKPEGYVLVVEPERVLLAGKDARGTYYAARTFLQLVAHATPHGGEPQAPCCTIIDWPDVPSRGYMIYTSGWPQDPVDAELLKEFIYKEVAGYKFNTLVWQVRNGYRFTRWPRLRNRCSLSRETVQEVARFARNHGLEILPNTNILGHANWIVLKYPELQEDGLPHQLCTRHPMTYPLLFDVLEEMLDVFDHPKRLHVGLDEVRWKTLTLPEAKRCPRCRGVPKWRIYADHVTTLRDFLASKGVEMWMWGDMLVDRHNGGPPFDCYRALDHIPKDIVICNWSAEYAKGSSRELVEKGFRVVKANSIQVPASEEPWVFGNLVSLWYRQPWCTMLHVGERGLMMRIAMGAEFSWNINRENLTLERYTRERDLNILRLVARPRVPDGGADYTPVDLAKAANRAVVDEKAGDGTGWADLGPDLDLRALPTAPVRVGPVAFTPVPGDRGARRAVYLTAEQPACEPLPLRAKVPSLAFLHTAVFPADADRRKAYFDRFLRPVDGVPVVTVRVTYAGGETVDVPLRVGMEVGSWLPTRDGQYLHRCPYLLRLPTGRSRRSTPGASDAHLYVYEWPNPHPTWRIDRIELRHTGTEAAYALLALSARAAKQAR